MEQKRNTGIDLLRIIAAFMVLILHILGQGGLLKALPVKAVSFKVGWSLEYLCFCAVNCFGLISGFSGFHSRDSYGRILRSWLQVFFFAVGGAVVMHLYKPVLVKEETIKLALLPVINKKYWYYTAYFCIAFFMPAMNRMVKAMEKRQLQLFIIGGAILLSVIPTFANKDLFYTNNGYSPIWLAYLYVVGGYLAKYPLKLHPFKCFLIYLLGVFLTCMNKFYPDFFESMKDISLAKYTSPTILVCAIFLLAGLAQCKFHKFFQKIIHFVAPLSFATYLLHAQGPVYGYFMESKFGKIAREGSLTIVLRVFAIALGWFLLGIAIDFVRDKLFKLIGVPKLCKKIDVCVDKFLSKPEKPLVQEVSAPAPEAAENKES